MAKEFTLSEVLAAPKQPKAAKEYTLDEVFGTKPAPVEQADLGMPMGDDMGSAIMAAAEAPKPERKVYTGSVFDTQPFNPEFNPEEAARQSRRAYAEQANKPVRRVQEMKATPKEQLERTAGQTALDVALGLAQGANAIPQSLAAGFGSDNPVAEYFKSASEAGQRAKSPYLQSQIATREGLLQSIGENQGEMARTIATAKTLFSPAGADIVAQGAGSMLPTVGMSLLGLTGKAMAATNALSVAGESAQNTAEALSKMSPEDWSKSQVYLNLRDTGLSHQDAVKTLAPLYALPSQLLGGVIGGVSGSTGLEAKLAGKPLTGGMLARGQRAGAELVGEELETLVPGVAKNATMNLIDDKTSLLSGLGREAVETAAGSLPGSLLAGTGRTRAKVKPARLPSAEQMRQELSVLAPEPKAELPVAPTEERIEPTFEPEKPLAPVPTEKQQRARTIEQKILALGEDLAEPAADTAQTAGQNLADRIGLPEGPARANAAHENIDIDDAILLRNMMVKIVDNGLAGGKTRQQIARQLENLTKGGIRDADFQRIHDYMTERGVKEESPVAEGVTTTPPAVAAPEADYANQSLEELQTLRDNADQTNHAMDMAAIEKHFGPEAAAAYEGMNRRQREKWWDQNATEALDRDASTFNGVNEDLIDEYIKAHNDFNTDSPHDLGRSVGLSVRKINDPGFAGSPEFVRLQNALNYAKQQGWSEKEVLNGMRERASEWAGADAQELFRNLFASKPAKTQQAPVVSSLPFTREDLTNEPMPERPEVQELLDKQAEATQAAEALSKRTAGTSLIKVLQGSLKDSEMSELGGRSRQIGKNPFISLVAKKGTPGASMENVVNSGLLDDFLPDNMRPGSPTYVNSESAEYIRDKLRQNQYYTYETQRAIEDVNRGIWDLEKLINEELSIDDINKEIQLAFDEQREADLAAETTPAKGEAGATEQRKAEVTNDELDKREAQLEREAELNKREARLLEERKRLEEERLKLESPTKEEVVQEDERKAKAAELDEREQIRKESEAGADQFELTSEEGRQDTTGNLFEQPETVAISPEQERKEALEQLENQLNDPIPPFRAVGAKKTQILRPAPLTAAQIKEILQLAADAMELGLPAAVLGNVKNAGSTRMKAGGVMSEQGSLMIGAQWKNLSSAEKLHTLVHELGHSVDFKSGTISYSINWSKAETELKNWYTGSENKFTHPFRYPYAPQYKGSVDYEMESFAEAFAAYFTSPVDLQKNAPEAYSQIQAIVERIQDGSQKARAAGTTERGTAGIKIQPSRTEKGTAVQPNAGAERTGISGTEGLENRGAETVKTEKVNASEKEERPGLLGRAKALVVEEDKLKRNQLTVGVRAHAVVANIANNVLDKFKMKPISPALNRAMKNMKAKVDAAKNKAAEVAAEMNALSPEERELISDVIEGELKAGVHPPQYVLDIAAAIQSMMSRQSKELVELGMLSKEASNRWDNKYLPRFYERQLSDSVSAWAKAAREVFMKQPLMRGIRGSNLRSRGIFQEAETADLQSWIDDGWEQRDPTFDPKKSKTTIVWRDYTREERENMGEIRDAMFRFVMGYNTSQRDIALGRLYKELAQSYASTQPREGYVEVPTGKAEGTNAPRYGALEGLYVPREIMDHLSANDHAMAEGILKIYRAGMSKWKEGKTVLNPVAHANNVMSNLTMAHFAGVSYWDAHKYAGAIKDLAKNDDMVKEAKEVGLFGGTFNQAELMKSMPPELREMANMTDSALSRYGERIWDTMAFTVEVGGKKYGARPVMQWAYENEDSFFRYLIYRDARNRGMNPEDARDYSQEFIFTYDDLPQGARMMRDYAMPFFGYTYKVVPVLASTALKYPWRFAAPATAAYTANAMMYAIAANLGGDDDDWWGKVFYKYITDPVFRKKAKDIEANERKYLPEWMKGHSMILATPKAIRMGVDEATKLPMFLDISRIFPGGDLLDANNNAGGVAMIQPLMPSNPVFNVLVAMLGNKDLFLGKDVTDASDTEAEKLQKRGAWLWKQAAPAIAIGNYHFDKVMNAMATAQEKPINIDAGPLGVVSYTGVGKDAQPIQPKHVAMQMAGIKIKPYDLTLGQSIQEGQKKKLIRELNTKIGKINRYEGRGVISAEAANAEREALMKKRSYLREGLTLEGEEKE
jgi:hypothetical protein